MPVAYGYRGVLVRGYVDQVVISCGPEVIARHPRSYERDDFVYDPIHYLPLLEQKTGALDHAAPLRGWGLPEEFGTLRRLLGSRMGRRGKREYVQVLRLLETFSQQEVHAAVRDAIRLGALSFDAVKHLVLCRLEGRTPHLDLELYPYLPRVSTTSARRAAMKCPACRWCADGSRSQLMIPEWNSSAAHLRGAMRSRASSWSRPSAMAWLRLVRVSRRSAEWRAKRARPRARWPRTLPSELLQAMPGRAVGC